MANTTEITFAIRRPRAQRRHHKGNTLFKKTFRFIKKYFYELTKITSKP